MARGRDAAVALLIMRAERPLEEEDAEAPRRLWRICIGHVATGGREAAERRSARAKTDRDDVEAEAIVMCVVYCKGRVLAM